MKIASKWIAFALLLVGLILVTFITSFIPGQVDLTAKNLYTLSQGSISIIEKIEDPVTLELYYSRTAEGTPIHIKNYANRVIALLRQYARASDGKVELRVIDPKPDTEEEEAAIRANIAQKQLPNGDPFFFGLSVIQADLEKEIPEFVLRKEPFLEYDISRAIYSVQQFGLPKLAVITSLPVFGGFQPNPMNPMNPNRQMTPDWFFIEELRESFEIEQVQAASTELPEDLDVLAVIHPQDLSESLQYAIDQFVLSGKPAFIAVDPSSYSQRIQVNQQAMMMGMGMPDASSSLTRLFDKWGIEYDAFSFVSDLMNGEMVGVGRGAAPVRYPAWHRVEALADDSPPTANLNIMHLIEPGSFDVKSGSGLELTPLIMSSDQSGTLSSGLLNFTPPEEIIRQTMPTGKAFILSGIISGKFATAFPEGKPKEESDAGAGADSEGTSGSGPGENEAPGLTASTDSSTVILIADTDFLAEQFSVQRIMPGVAIRQNDNLSFISNSLEYLAGSEDLISLRGKGTAVRPFKVLQELEVQAQRNYQEEYDALDNELNEVREKLRELQESEGSPGQLVASSDVRQLIENYRHEEADKQAALREIRKKLREDVEFLETLLSLLNLLVVPIAVGAMGIGFFMLRNKRQKQARG